MIKVFITGGTGSLGRALAGRLIKDGWVSHITILSRDEVKQGEMRRQYPDCKYILGNVADKDDLELDMRGHDVVIHAAAYKQVPAAEVNTIEAIKTNVDGSLKVARASRMAGVKKVIGISTDKACAPINTYGQTKALMEKSFAQASGPDTQFVCVRYGNVIGSRGSILPLFREQAKMGKLTVTDPFMTRFWLTLEEAVDLILFACQEKEAGTVIVPKCPASTMQAFARAVSDRAEIEVVGTRPGEKTHEQLLHKSEAQHADDIGGHFRIWPAFMGRRGNLPEGYEYRSDTARHLSISDLRRMLPRGN